MSDITTTTECTIEDYRQILHWERENLEHQQKYSRSLENKAQKLERQLVIAVEALEYYKDRETWRLCEKCQCAYVDGMTADLALKKIKELEK